MNKPVKPFIPPIQKTIPKRKFISKHSIAERNVDFKLPPLEKNQVYSLDFSAYLSYGETIDVEDIEIYIYEVLEEENKDYDSQVAQAARIEKKYQEELLLWEKQQEKKLKSEEYKQFLKLKEKFKE